MVIPLPSNGLVIFDLDDTLYEERDFVFSGFQAVSRLIEAHTGTAVFGELVALFQSGEKDVFGKILERLSSQTLSKQEMLQTYRMHFPTISPAPGAISLLRDIRGKGISMGMITDGRSSTQHNKIKALGIEGYFDLIVISEEIGTEKPAMNNYRPFLAQFGRVSSVVVGDNPCKDFVTPNKLGWLTVGIENNARHIHQNRCTSRHFAPKYKVHSLSELQFEVTSAA